MANLNAIYQFILSTNSNLKIGSATTTVVLPLATGEVFHSENVVLQDDYEKKRFWTAGDGGLTTFTAGVLVSSKNLFIEIRNDKGTPEYATIGVYADHPFIIPGAFGGNASSARLDGDELVLGTDFGNTDEITLQSAIAAAGGDALVDLYLFK